MTYLELCQAFVQELGIAGGGSNNPTSVTGQTGELLNVVNWIREAEYQINNQARDWKYLWAEYAQAMAIDDQAPTIPSNPRARAWVKSSFWLDHYGPSQKKLLWIAYKEFANYPTIPTEPLKVTLKPNGQLSLDAPMSDALTLTGEYYKAPTPLTAGADVPAMPAEYHRIILCRAVLIYAGREDAPELTNHYEPEYLEILSHLEADQRPQREQEDDPDAYNHIEQVIPGHGVPDPDSFGG